MGQKRAGGARKEEKVKRWEGSKQRRRDNVDGCERIMNNVTECLTGRMYDWTYELNAIATEYE